MIDIGRAWLRSRIDLSRQSQRVYSAYLDAIESEPLGQIDVASITPADVRSQIGWWLSAGLAPKTIRERVNVVRQALDFAEIEPNPARHRSIKLPAPAEQELVLPSGGDFLSILDGVAAKHRLPLAILEQTAMRVVGARPGLADGNHRNIATTIRTPLPRHHLPARELADRAGHSRPSMSLDVYAHVIAPDEVEPEAVARILGNPAPAKKHDRDAPVMHKSLPPE